jgi:hypothetical protein
VVIIGYNPSGMDISRDIAGVAEEVHVAIRSVPCLVQSATAHANLWLHSMVISSTNIYLILSANINLLILLQIFYCRSIMLRKMARWRSKTVLGSKQMSSCTAPGKFCCPAKEKFN